MSLGKVGKEKDVLRIFNLQLKCGRDDLKFFMCSQKKTFMPYGHRADITKNQTQILVNACWTPSFSWYLLLK